MPETYTRQELVDLVEGRIELTYFDNSPRIKRMNKLEGITDIILTMDELDNINNLENNTLFMYDMTANENSTHFEPYIPQYNTPFTQGNSD